MTRDPAYRTPAEALAQLVPFGRLPGTCIEALADFTTVLTLAPGEGLPAGVTPRDHTCYVVEGEVELLVDDQSVGQVQASSPEGRLSLSHRSREHTALRATQRARILYCERATASAVMVLAGERGEIFTRDPEFICGLLRSALFSRVPTANLERIFEVLEPIPVAAREPIVVEGEPGDFYYVILEGRFDVLRKPPNFEAPLRLAQLGPGQGFGEEALVSGSARNATVRAATDSVVLRMRREDFLTLVRDPMLRVIDEARATDVVNLGAQWLDVREPEEHVADGITGSVNLPLRQLRAGMLSLDRAVPYVVYCNSGQRSRTAAFILSGNGFSACVLDGGRLGAIVGPDGRSGSETNVAPLTAAADIVGRSASIERELVTANAALEIAIEESAAAEAACTVARQASDDERLTEEAERRIQDLAAEADRAGAVLETHKHRKLELEGALRAADEFEKNRREKLEQVIAKLREKADLKLRDDQARLSEHYAAAAERLERIETEQRETKERYEAEMARLDESYRLEREALETRAQRIRADVARSRDKAQRRAEIIAERLGKHEQDVRAHTEAHLRAERERLEAEFAESVAAQEQARAAVERAVRAREEAREEARVLAAQFAAVSAERQQARVDAAAEQQQRFSAAADAAGDDLERAEEAHAHAVARAEVERAQTAADETEAVAPDPGDDEAESPESGQALQQRIMESEARLAEAEQQLIAAREARVQAEEAQFEAETQLSTQRSLEDELRAQLQAEANLWLEEQNALAEANRGHISEIEAGLDRIQAEKQERRREAATSDASLFDDILSQLDA